MLTVTNVVSCDRQLRYGRVLCVRVASLGRMTRAMAKDLKESKFMERSTFVDGLLDVTTSICNVSGGRAPCASTSRYGQARPISELGLDAYCMICWSQVDW